jgi:hypothetical protein
MRLIIIFISFLFLSNCASEAFSMPDNWNWGFRPRPYLMRGVPDGNDDYSLGFRDGCKSVLNTVAEGMVRNIKPVYDGWLLTSNNLYASGFVDGEEHCTYFYDWDIT